MLRHSAVRASRTLARQPCSRTFSTALRAMAEGDTGATRSGGASQGDAFTKREQASEDKYVKEQEMQRLRQLRKKLQDQQENLNSLQKDIDTMLNETGEAKKP